MLKEKKYSDQQRWISIYPAYINSKKALSGGRRLPKEKCVENPTFHEIWEVVKCTSGINVAAEDKVYPRENSREVATRGRLKIQLKNDDNTPFNENFTTREAYMLHVSELIQKLRQRSTKPTKSEVHPHDKLSVKNKKGKGRK